MREGAQLAEVKRMHTFNEKKFEINTKDGVSIGVSSHSSEILEADAIVADAGVVRIKYRFPLNELVTTERTSDKPVTRKEFFEMVKEDYEKFYQSGEGVEFVPDAGHWQLSIGS